MNITSPPKRWALTAPGKTVSVHGVRLNVRDPGGSGLPIVALHAAGHGSADFDSLRARLPDRRIITIDWPGHGRSADDAVPASAVRYAELLRGALDVLALQRVVLLGSSVGGAAALSVAASAPNRVAALILANSGGLAAPTATVRRFSRAMAWAYRRGDAGSRWFQWFFALQYSALLRGRHVRPLRDRIVAAGREHTAVLCQLWTSFGEPANDHRALVARIRCPVWLPWARSDPYNGLQRTSAALRGFGVKPTLFDGAHLPFAEAPSLFAERFEAFLKACPECSGALPAGGRA